MAAKNDEEDKMINKIDEADVLHLFRILRIDIKEVVDAVEQTKASGLIPVAIGMRHPVLTVMGIPILFEENATSLFVYSQDRSQLN